MFILDKHPEFHGFKPKLWLGSPTMHGPELDYMKEAFDTNWMSTVGENINEIEKGHQTGSFGDVGCISLLGVKVDTGQSGRIIAE